MFTVPIIPKDLRHEETIIQAAHALCCLEKTIFTIFDRFDKRIKENDDKIEDLISRIGRAQDKVKGLVGTKKAIKIYAPSRFPATHILRNDNDIPQTFSRPLLMADQEEIEGQSVNEPLYEVKSRVEAPTSQTSNEKLVFFHVRTGDSRHELDLASARSSLNQQHGMGPIPTNIRSVTSTLCFDSDEFVYESESSSSDSWRQAKLFKKQRRQPQQGQSVNQRPQLAPAPHSFTHRDQRATLSGTLRYTPRLSELPDLNLPLDLPDLPGMIADDIQFIAQEEQNIAPSLYIEDLPDLEELQQAQDLQEESNENSNIINADTSQLAATIPPPPTPAMYPPPPPPPPPPQISNTSLQVNLSQSSNLPTISNTHSDLMAAIRSAGGAERAKLRPAAAIDVIDKNSLVPEPRDSGDTNVKPSSAGRTGGGLMEELHSKLMLRRKGISGTKEKGLEESPSRSSASNPLFTNLSSLIPQTSRRKSQSGFGDEDDEDEFESNDNEWTD